ncbi:DUF2510 domain-containing protein [Mycolicibacterium mucogenicum]|nr:DUF2510 domain-containing protein [Mycolicibacterium mucogenicum]
MSSNQGDARPPAAETYPQVLQPASYEQVMPYTQSAPPAGWHPDPHSPGILRYWDGWQWTEHRSAVTPQATAVVYNNVQVRGGGDGGRILLHLVLIFLTCGIWIPFAIIIEIAYAVSK